MKRIQYIGALLLALLMMVTVVACGDKSETYTQMDYMAEDLTPYVTLGQYKGLTLAATPITVSEASVESMIANLISNYSNFERYETPVTDRLTEAGDYLLIDFAGFMDGEQFEGGTAEGAYVLLADDNGYIDWFEDDLYGIMPGTTVETTDFFPENYGNPEFAGKEATFKITVHSIAGHYYIPELTDEFVKSKTGCETVEAYRELVYNSLLESATQSANMERYQLMWTAIMENATIHELPEEHVMFCYTSDRSYYESVAAEYGYTYDEYLAACGATDADVKQMVEDVIREELVFYAIVKAEGLSISDEEYEEGLAMYAAAQSEEISPEDFEAMYGKDAIVDALLWDEMIYALFDTTIFVTE